MPHRLTLTEMAAQVRARALSPVELVDAHLARIEKLNPKLNAFVVLLAQEARAEAKEAEQRVMSGDPPGPLDGVPVTIKDSFDMAGLATTCGSRFFRETRAAHDSTAVRRLRGAGAIPLGKTNCPEFLGNYETDNYIIGRTNNPWDFERTPGGSSGGESAAIASFCSPGGIGSDGGGSIRVPAHCTGIAGLKPTPGRVSAAGHVPAIAHPGGLLGVGGPMARNARDVKLLFEVLAGYDTEDPFSAPVPLRSPELSGLRIGVMEQFYDVPVQPAIAEAVRKAARAAEGLGFAVEEFQPRGLERAPNLWWFFFGQVPARFTQALIAGREADAHWTGTEFMEKALAEPEPTAMKIVENLAVRDKMRAALLREMERFPVLITPVCGTTAWKHRQRRYQTATKEIGLFEAMMPVTWLNLLGLPGMVIPFGTDESGLPVGIQLVGRPWEEELLLELAIRLEEARGPSALPSLVAEEL
jgi:Asp-tRNA(Asn)/Glu-tRNA(Gln) amidotransferase A subunit family amidase